MGALADQLANVRDPKERHRIKAEAMAALSDMRGRSVKRGAFTITLSDGPRLTMVNGNPLLEFGLTITRTTTGKDVTPKDLNPIRVWNPPILVDDPAGEVVRTFTDENGVVQTRRLREDLRAAMLEVVKDLARQKLG